MGSAKFITETTARTLGRRASGSTTDGDPRGYGFGQLPAATKPRIPMSRSGQRSRSVGAAGFPVNDLRFQCFAPFRRPARRRGICGDAMADRADFRARYSRLRQPGSRAVMKSKKCGPRRNSRNSKSEIQIPASAVTPGGTYRARVRLKDVAGRWSRWSEAAQFVAGGGRAASR